VFGDSDQLPVLKPTVTDLALALGVDDMTSKTPVGVPIVDGYCEDPMSCGASVSHIPACPDVQGCWGGVVISERPSRCGCVSAGIGVARLSRNVTKQSTSVTYSAE